MRISILTVHLLCVGPRGLAKSWDVLGRAIPLRRVRSARGATTGPLAAQRMG